MGSLDVVRIQLGRALLCLSGVIGALGLRPVPLAAWLAAVAVNVLLATAVVAPLVRALERREPGGAALLAAAGAAGASLAPALAPVAAGLRVRATLAAAVFALAFLAWRLHVARRLALAAFEAEVEAGEPRRPE